MKRLLLYALAATFSPAIAAAYGISWLLRGARPFRGSFPSTHRWYRLAIPAERARSSDGSPYAVYLKKGTVNRLVVFFSGGGVSWDGYTAARPITPATLLNGEDAYYFPAVHRYLELMNGGILAANDPRNPFNDWSFILLPYSTGDFHVGHGTFAYRDRRGRDRVLYHWGARNVRAALEVAAPLFGSPEQLLIAGESAGAFGCVAQAPEVLKHFAGCRRIIIYSDSGQLFWPRWQEVVRDVWKADPVFWECITSGGNLILDWFRWLYGRLGDRAIYLQSCSIYDGILSTFQSKMNHGAFVCDRRAISGFALHLGETVRALSREVPGYRYYLTDQGQSPRDGSTPHTTCRYARFYSGGPKGVSVAAWLEDAASGRRLHNVGEGLVP